MEENHGVRFTNLEKQSQRTAHRLARLDDQSRHQLYLCWRCVFHTVAGGGSSPAGRMGRADGPRQRACRHGRRTADQPNPGVEGPGFQRKRNREGNQARRVSTKRDRCGAAKAGCLLFRKRGVSGETARMV